MHGLERTIVIVFCVAASAVVCPPRLHAQAPQAALVIGSSLDAATTMYALKVNPRAYEANPLLAQGGLYGFAAGKAAATSALVLVITKLEKKHPRWAKVIGYGGGAALSGLAANNFRLARAR